MADRLDEGIVVKHENAVDDPEAVAAMAAVDENGCFYTKREKKEPGEDLLSFDFNYSVKPTYDGTVLRKRNNTDFDLPMFSYASVSAATNNFSPENKLGEGGFGPVYKVYVSTIQAHGYPTAVQWHPEGTYEKKSKISQGETEVDELICSLL